jgi:hypothetical protein
MNFCTQCRRVWEKIGKKVFFYDDFPAYGKPQVGCPKCRVQSAERKAQSAERKGCGGIAMGSRKIKYGS